MLQKFSSAMQWLSMGSCALVLLSACQKTPQTSTETARTDTATTNPSAPPEATNPNPVTNHNIPRPIGMADPFTYCSTVGNIDAPDNRYSGVALPPHLLQAMIKSNVIGEDLPILHESGYVSWRCMVNKVWVCIIGANIPCGSKADTSTQPNAGMLEFCKTEPNAENIPAAATGRTTVYLWSCKSGKPIKGKQVTTVDARGYTTDYWTEVQPQ